MPILRHAFLLVSMTGLLAACRYQGSLDETKYTPLERQKLAASVALVDDGRLDKLHVIGSQPYGFDLGVGPAIKQALTKELEAGFSRVTTVPAPSVSDDVDFYALPNVSWVPGDPMPQVYNSQLTIRLLVATRQTRHIVADYRITTPVVFRPPGEAVAASVGSAATLFALAPITETIKTDAMGKEVEGKARLAVEDAMRRLGQAMATDQRLDIAIALGPVQDAAPAGSSVPSPYDKFLNAVVVIRAGHALGSGFFISKDGMIVTCRHVVGDAKTVEVKDRKGETFTGEVVDSSAERDLALVKVPGSGFAALPLVTSEAMPAIGRDVIAVGTPEGMSWSVSKGIVSALRSLRTARVVQTDAAFSPGSSGGPLIDPASGRVVGIASLMMSGQGAVNFAIAADEVRKAFATRLSGL